MAENDSLIERSDIHHVLHNTTFANYSILRDLDPNIIIKYQRNRSIEEPAFSLLIAAYCILILVGAAGNSLVVCVVVRKRSMRTARNMFIVNLAVSDLLLCLITMPFTLMEILVKYWPLGRLAFLCKMVGTLQATSIFVSSVSNTAIALDRYQVIVYPTRENLQKLGAVIILSCIWLVSLVLASPLFIWRTLNHYDINLPDIDYIAYCLEDWPLQHGRVYYSIFSLVFQYVVPFITVSVAYSRICRKLRYRYVNSSIAKGKNNLSNQGSTSSTRRKTKSDRRMKRTNTLLVCTALIFCISWLPLNIFNIVMDLWNPVMKDNESMLICYAVMHMMGMSSACSNPLLYGWLNDNFRKEFQEILGLLCPCVPVDAVRERVGSLKSSVSRRRRRRHKSASGSSAGSGLGGVGGGCVGGGGGGGGGGDGGGGGGSTRNRRGGGGDGMDDPLAAEATSDELRDKEETVMAISGYRRGTETLTTTENGTGTLQQDTEMTTLTRA